MSATSKRLKSQANQQLTFTTKSIAKATSPVKSSIAGGRQRAVTEPTKLPINPNKQSRSPSAAHAKTKPEPSASRLSRPAASKPCLPGLTKRRPPAGSKPVRCNAKLLPTDVPAAPQAVDSAPATNKRALDSDSAEDKHLVSPQELPLLENLRQKLQADADALPDEQLTLELVKQRNSSLATRCGAEAPLLRKAHCDGERISTISPAAVACLAGVESLYLQRNRLQGLRELAGLTGLRFLTLAHNRLTVLSGVEHLTRLLFLDVSHNQLQSVNSALLPPSIAFLQVRDNPACQAQPHLPQQLVAALPRLRQLDGVDVEGMSEGASPAAEQREADSSAGAAEGSSEGQSRDGHDAVDRAMDMLDVLAELDLDSPACQQAATAAALASVIQQPEASLGDLQSSTLLQEGQGSGQPLLQGGSDTAADCNVAGGPGVAVEEGAAGAAQRNRDPGAMSALQQGQSVHDPFSRTFASLHPSCDDSVGAEVEHLKQSAWGCSSGTVTLAGHCTRDEPTSCPTMLKVLQHLMALSPAITA